jgi:hypothetical protein
VLIEWDGGGWLAGEKLCKKGNVNFGWKGSGWELIE